MVKSPALSGIVEELKNWPGQVLSSHKSARQPFHKISFIAELGFNTSDPGIDVISRKMMEHISEDGIIKLPMNISKSYGVTGSDIWGWTLCDALVNLYALAKIGLKDDHRIKSGVDSLAKLIRDNGWPCVVSKELGRSAVPEEKMTPAPMLPW